MTLSKAQIKQQAINEAAKKFRDSIEGYKKRLAQLQEDYNNLWQRNCQLDKENEELKEEVNKLKEWNDRFMEFTNLSDADIQKTFEALKVQKELQEEEKRLFKFCNRYLQCMY